MKTKTSIVVGLSLFTIIVLSGCVTKNAKITNTKQHIYNNQSGLLKKVIYGKASFYANKYNGRKTASGEIYNMYAKTAAHRTLPFNTMVRVTDMVTHKSDIVRINDRGPYSKDRVIDLSYASAKKIGLIKRGVGNVKIEVLRKERVQTSRPLSLLRKDRVIQACVGDNCKATFAKEEDSSTKVQPFTLLSNIEDIDTTPKIANSFRKTSIQVGAFRRYKGAKIYAKRYSLLSRKYKTVIKNEFKENRPIYRVRIEGFSNENEARKFMSRYSLNGAFLVSR